MNRRSFFRSMVGGVVATAAVRTFPFRVFSFPTALSLESFTKIYVNPAMGTLFADMDRSLDFRDSFDRAVMHEKRLLDGMIDRWNTGPAVLVDREVVTVESWDARNRKLLFHIPGRSEHPFTAKITG